MLARFFIDRPVLAWVISLVIVLLGAIAAGFLPIAEYPEITPPNVRVTAYYPETGRPYYDQLYMSNYATIHLKDALARVEGVGDVAIFGQQDYSMRVWLDPDKLQSRNLTAGDVIRVLREQNVQVAAGQIGQPPVPNGQDFQYTMSTLGRLVDAEQFANIVLKTGTDGEVTYLKDVDRIELGAKSQDQLSRLDGKPSAGLAIFLLPGSNALDTADLTKAKMRELVTRFPRGLRYGFQYDTTPFIRESVNGYSIRCATRSSWSPSSS